MRICHSLTVLLAVGSSLCAQQPLRPIPSVHGALLSGDPLDLPAALRGHTAVLVLGFSQASRAQVTGWGRLLAADYRQSPTVLYYEMPVLADVPRLLRPLVLRQIRAGVPDRAKPHCIALLDHEEEWKRLADFSQGDDAYILLVDGNGQVLDHWSGEPTPAAYGIVKQRLTALGPT